MSGEADSALDALAETLGHRFRQPELLADALTHRSAAPRLAGTRKRGEARTGFGYERLEFLGDRVLGLVVAEMLLEAYPAEPEGALARRHADLVRRETLAVVAQAIDLPSRIRLPVGEETSARSNPTLLADVCEAVIAALYLDGSLDVARSFIIQHWGPRMAAVLAPPKDAKTELQEWAQGRGKPLPVYETIEAEGPPHQPVFTVAVTVDGVVGASASGPSKRVAEAGAASAMLEHIRACAKESE
jgi:ribonuclease-3